MSMKKAGRAAEENVDAVGSRSLGSVSRLSVKKAVRSFTTLGGRDFVSICCDGRITHFMDVQSESQRLMSVSGAGHEGSSVDPGSSFTVLAFI